MQTNLPRFQAAIAVTVGKAQRLLGRTRLARGVCPKVTIHGGSATFLTWLTTTRELGQYAIGNSRPRATCSSQAAVQFKALGCADGLGCPELTNS